MVRIFFVSEIIIYMLFCDFLLVKINKFRLMLWFVIWENYVLYFKKKVKIIKNKIF